MIQSMEDTYLNVLGKGNKRRQIPLKEKVLNSIRIFRNARGLEEFNGCR